MTNEPASTRFLKVAECLYRNESSGRYYALLKRSGKQIRRSLKTSDRKLAERRLRDFRAKVDQLDPKKGKLKITFDDLGKTWLDTLRPTLKQSSFNRRELSYRQLKRYFGGVNIRHITRAQCEQWAQKRSPQLAASSFNNERETLISILDYGEREGLLLANVARVVRRRKMGKTHMLIPSREQFETLVKTMRAMDPRYQAGADLVELLAYSGSRLGEATQIRWGDIDFERGFFVITGGETGTKNHDPRTVPLFPILRAYFLRIRSEREKLGQAVGTTDRITATSTAKKAIDAASRKAGLPHFSHHCMRHFFVSNAIEKGIDFKTIAAWVGHKDGGLLVAKTYGHLRDTHSFEMAKLMV